MDLFEEECLNASKNLLPKDGTVLYYGKLVPSDKASKYFHELMQSIDWKHDEAVIHGKRISTRRKVAWYGDQPFRYTYSQTTKCALPWTPLLLDLKQQVENRTNETYNSCLLNLYHDGSEGMAWHSDAEKELKKNGAIASLSLGAERKFAFKHKQTKETLSFELHHGSLLVMTGETQRYWLHRLPPTQKVHTPRINLTFRTIETT